MLPRPLDLTPQTARRFARRALGLDQPFPSVAAALEHHGYVQIDPINVCGRMHDLILRNRVAGYREGDLHRHVHSAERPGFEHYLPGRPFRPRAPAGVLVAYPIEAWRYLSGLIHSRELRGGVYGRKLGPKAERIAQHILAEIAARGPLTSDDIEHEGTARTAWGTRGRLVKNILEVLFVQGRVLIAQRRNFRRVYDLPARVLPPQVLAAPPADRREVTRWAALGRLRQRRLVTLTPAELAHVGDDVHPVRVDGCPPLFCLRADRPLLEACHDDAPDGGLASGPDRATPLLLAPLDPLIYDRRVTARLWGFDYTWEVYTPPAKRVRGYYALPVLAGTEIIGHIDSKAERASRRLVVLSRRIRRGHSIAAAVRGFARWLGLQ